MKEDWKTEFREYFDKTLKPKKPTMKNLDREILVDFIEKQILKERERILDLVLNAGKNSVPMLDNEENFTGTYWISQNMLVFYITGKYLSEHKDH